LIGPSQQNRTIEVFSKIEIYIGRWSGSLWPTYKGENMRTLGKTYVIKTWCCWENLGEHIWNNKKNQNSHCDKWF